MSRYSDPVTLILHLKNLKQLPKNMVAYAAYGSEENYAYLEEHQLGNYLEYSKQRSVDVETVFGHIKHNMRFRRFHLRGLEKVDTEWGLVCIAHNMRKLAGSSRQFFCLSLFSPLLRCFWGLHKLLFGQPSLNFLETWQTLFRMHPGHQQADPSALGILVRQDVHDFAFEHHRHPVRKRQHFVQVF